MAVDVKKVLIVDDSALVRGILKEILSSSPHLDVVGSAEDPFDARKKIKALRPDVITLDVEMPRMDGITFLNNLMRLHPIPVVMISTLTAQGADVTLRALELGAVDFIEKPRAGLQGDMAGFSEEVIIKVVGAAHARVQPMEFRRDTAPLAQGGKVIPAHSPGSGLTSSTRPASDSQMIIGIGASTGGTEAIKAVLRTLPAEMPGIIISQHIPAAFSGPFARRVNGESALTVCEAADGQEILPGHAYVAPGNRHLQIIRRVGRFHCCLDDGPPVNRHKPSVDVMLDSMAHCKGLVPVGVMLTGMGMDGASGMGVLKNVGGMTLVQDERSSVVWGMPGEVVKRGFADEVLALERIPNRLAEMAGC